MSKKLALLQYINRMRIKDRKKELERERDAFKKYRGDAFRRMKAQEAAGQTESAARSRSAYNYCSEYVTKLNHVIDGFDHMLKGGCYFTKDGANRYRKKTGGGS